MLFFGFGQAAAAMFVKAPKCNSTGKHCDGGKLTSCLFLLYGVVRTQAHSYG